MAYTTFHLRVAAVALGASLASGGIAAAETPAEFFRGKSVKLLISSSPGGGYDTYGRMLAKHLVRHIPGEPQLVPQNMQGASGKRLANYMFNVAPRDGSAIAGIHRNIPTDPIIGVPDSNYDSRAFNWLASLNNEVSVCAAWHTAPVTTIEQARSRELIVGAQPNSDSEVFPAVMNNMIGTKFKVVNGYPSGTDIELAMEKREVDGRCGWSWNSLASIKADWLRDRKVAVLVQMSMTKHPELPEIPLLLDMVRDPSDRQALELIFARQVFARPYLAPPAVPADRVAALRAAFLAVTRDPAFLADIEKQKFELNPIGGEEMQAYVARLYETPPAVVERAAAVMKQSSAAE
ncbi:MAG: Bug family tripartite tricarboxylate transporter substrate binding protein [Gemmatimonas sp.]